MTHSVDLPRICVATAWRDTARNLLAARVRPEDVVWNEAPPEPALFASDPLPCSKKQVKVPRSFLALANSVVWHNDPARFARLYAFLWRVSEAPALMVDRGDADLAILRRMEKNVHRCQHKMKAFVRFREIGAPHAARRSFAAWFEPTHHTVEPTAGFFMRRFGDMDWRIFTPDISAIFEDGKLRLVEDVPKPDFPDDASEDLWLTYFQNIFNPARLKLKAMQSEMPKKYWKNMPETAAIPQMIAEAPARARKMALAAPTLPSVRTEKVLAQFSETLSQWEGSSDDLTRAIRGCTRCPLHANATRAVVGEGPHKADLLFVGEQPGDQEDLTGRPFVGSAGKIFDAGLAAAGLNRNDLYVTNAVKHFKYVPRGRRRLHQRPNQSEISHCRPWLAAEIAQVEPRLIVGMGATAALALTGNGAAIAARRGQIEVSHFNVPVLLTYHPSYILRARDPGKQDRARDAFQADLRHAGNLVSGQENIALKE